MRTSLTTPARFGILVAALLVVVGLAGCGGGSGERTADSGISPELPSGLASVDVTYYYLPG